MFAVVVFVATNISAANTAVFSWFNYAGKDSYYRQPLDKPGMAFNPVISGWASDPSICRVGDDYWLVTSSFGYYPGVPLYHSRDLVTWRLVNNILRRPSQLPHLIGQDIGRGGIYAPTIRYNRHNKTYYMITTDVGKGHFYVTAEDPRGSWSDPVWLDAIDGIDPSFFFDDDGSAYIVYKEDVTGQPKWSNYRCIRFIRFDTVTGKTIGESQPLREEGVGLGEQLARDEGPHLYKKDGKYYLLCAEGGTAWAHSEVCYRADSVMGTYHRWSRNPMLTQRLPKDKEVLPVTCTGHVDMVETPQGDWWALFLGCRPWNKGQEQLGRETFLMPVKWSQDGFPYITMTRDTIPLVQQGPFPVRQEQAETGNFRWHDDFRGDKLQSEWLSLRGSVDGMQLSGNGLLLPCSQQLSSGFGVPSYLGRRIQHHCYEASTRMVFAPAGGDAAGMLVFKDERHQYFLCLTTSGVEVRTMTYSGWKTLATSSENIPMETSLELKVVCDGSSYSFQWRIADGRWQIVADGLSISAVSSSSGGYTGTTIGLYAENGGK